MDQRSLRTPGQQNHFARLPSSQESVMSIGINEEEEEMAMSWREEDDQNELQLVTSNPLEPSLWNKATKTVARLLNWQDGKNHRGFAQSAVIFPMHKRMKEIINLVDNTIQSSHTLRSVGTYLKATEIPENLKYQPDLMSVATDVPADVLNLPKKESLGGSWRMSVRNLGHFALQSRQVLRLHLFLLHVVEAILKLADDSLPDKEKQSLKELHSFYQSFSQQMTALLYIQVLNYTMIFRDIELHKNGFIQSLSREDLAQLRCTSAISSGLWTDKTPEEIIMDKKKECQQVDRRFVQIHKRPRFNY